MARGVILRGRSNSMPNVVVPVFARGIERRRNGLGHIFKGHKTVETGNKMFKRSLSMSTDMTKRRGKSVQHTLTLEDFEIGSSLCNGNEGNESSYVWRNEINRDYPDVMEREINVDNWVTGLDQIGDRRLALADIFENVKDDCLLELLALYSRIAVNLKGGDRLETRRNGLGYVYDNINEDQLKMFLTGYDGNILYCNGVDTETSSGETSDEEEQVVNYVRCRRNAMADIYDGLEPDDVQTIAGDRTDIEEEAKNFDFVSRRMGLTDIEDIVSLSDRLRSDGADSGSEMGDLTQCRSRRAALSDIFSDLDSDEISSFLRRFRENNNDSTSE